MNKDEKIKLICKQTASIINNIALINSVNCYYDLFCNSLDISSNITIKNIYCSDNNKILIDIINACKHNDINKIYYMISDLIRVNNDNKNDEYYLKNLYLMIKLINEYNKEDIKLNTIDDVVRYNKDMHTERLEKEISFNSDTLDKINLQCEDYRNIEIQDNSIVLIYPPFEKSNILEDNFGRKRFNEWFSNIKNRNILLLYLGLYKIDNDLELVTDFSDIIQLNKRDSTNLKLYMLNNLDNKNNTNDFDF